MPAIAYMHLLSQSTFISEAYVTNHKSRQRSNVAIGLVSYKQMDLDTFLATG